jgi:hypothetical protein
MVASRPRLGVSEMCLSVVRRSIFEAGVNGITSWNLWHGGDGRFEHCPSQWLMVICFARE